MHGVECCVCVCGGGGIPSRFGNQIGIYLLVDTSQER